MAHSPGHHPRVDTPRPLASHQQNLSRLLDGLLRRDNINERRQETRRVPTRLELIARQISASKEKDNGVKSIKTMADRVLYARNRNGRSEVTGGAPISEETAMALRSLVFGTAMAPPRSEWTRTGLWPGDHGDYQLCGPRNTTRGLLTVLQAELLKFLLFDKTATKGEPPEKSLNPGLSRLQEGMVHSVCAVLWRVGEKAGATICLPQEKIYLYQSMEYYQDGITEKLHTFEVTNYDDLQIIVKRYSHLFLEDPGPGALLLLYSCILTRGIKKVEKELDGSRSMLVGIEEEGSLCLVTLLLTGRATPYLHNGVIYVGDEDHYAVPRFGILSRSEIGLLIHSDLGTDDGETNLPGSRLKTPSLPIWVVLVDGHFAILFNTNRELLHNYHAERRFELIYLSCGGSRYQLTVDTRHTSYSDYSQSDEVSGSNVAGVEKVIQTKWPDANVIWQISNSNKQNISL